MNNDVGGVTTNPAEVAAVFCDALTDAMRQMSGFEIRTRDDDAQSLYDYTALLNMAGGETGAGATLILSAEGDTLRSVCSYMTGTAPEDVTELELRDTLCELANITGGSAKVRLRYRYGFALGGALLFKGCNMEMFMKKRVRRLSQAVGNGLIDIKLRLIY